MHRYVQVRAILTELARRRIEALKLYEPLPVQAAFHASKAQVRVVRGSNRSGKTLSAAVEVARAVTGLDPHDKYPKKNGRIYVVGKNLDHVGQVMYRKLFRESFKIIRDKATGIWRAFRPWDPCDAARISEVKTGQPLIPRRFIESIAWENKAKSIPKLIKLVNGWELNFYSSEGKPPRGADIDLWWFDEEIVDPDWFPEMQARILDRKGKGIWSATPQSGTEQLLSLHEQAENSKDDPNAQVQEYVVLLADNPHVGEEEKQKFAATISEDEQAVRIGGDFAINQWRVYPEFSLTAHTCAAFPIPTTWTRYMVVDPGRQVCAVLFAAVPPPEEGDFVYLYDELYIRNCSAVQFGEAVRLKSEGIRYEAFIIDNHGSRVHDTGSGLSVEMQYSRALAKARIKSRRTGHGFIWGSDDVKAGVESFRSWMLVRDDGTTKVRILQDKLPHFIKEIKYYRYKRVNQVPTDEPESRGAVHLMACARYLAMARPRYHKHKIKDNITNPAVRAFKDKQKRMKKQQGGGINLGPGSRTWI